MRGTSTIIIHEYTTIQVHKIQYNKIYGCLQAGERRDFTRDSDLDSKVAERRSQRKVERNAIQASMLGMRSYWVRRVVKVVKVSRLGSIERSVKDPELPEGSREGLVRGSARGLAEGSMRRLVGGSM